MKIENHQPKLNFYYSVASRLPLMLSPERMVWQTEMRITDEILSVKELVNEWEKCAIEVESSQTLEFSYLDKASVVINKR